jgi:hypothetical protein
MRSTKRDQDQVKRTLRLRARAKNEGKFRYFAVKRTYHNCKLSSLKVEEIEVYCVVSRNCGGFETVKNHQNSNSSYPH